MATTSKVLFRGAATTNVTTTLYTVTSGVTAVVTNIIVTNTTNTDETFTLSLDDIKLAETVSVPALDSTVIDLKQVLPATKTIKGGASKTAVNFHISGVEIT